MQRVEPGLAVVRALDERTPHILALDQAMLQGSVGAASNAEGARHSPFTPEQRVLVARATTQLWHALLPRYAIDEHPPWNRPRNKRSARLTTQVEPLR